MPSLAKIKRLDFLKLGPKIVSFGFIFLVFFFFKQTRSFFHCIKLYTKVIVLTIFKCTTQWHSVHSHCWANTSRTFSSSQTESRSQWNTDSPSPSPRPCPLPILPSVSKDLISLGTFCEWNQILFTLLCLASLTEHHDLGGVLPHCSRYLNLLPFYGWVVFHCVDVPQFVYSSYVYSTALDCCDEHRGANTCTVSEIELCSGFSDLGLGSPVSPLTQWVW